jgi:Domain of unknown function (DUF4845)
METAIDLFNKASSFNVLRRVTVRQPLPHLLSTPLTAGASIFVMNAILDPPSTPAASPLRVADHHSQQESSGDSGSRRNADSADPPARCRRSGWTSEKGAGHLRAILWTLVLASCIYVAFKVVPYLVNEYQFQDGMQEIARYASAMHQDPAKVHDAVLKEAEKDDVPVGADDIKVEGTGGNFRISADYSVTVDLTVYQWTLNFHPSVSNNAVY